MKELRDLKDLTIHDVQPVNDELNTGFGVRVYLRGGKLATVRDRWSTLTLNPEPSTLNTGFGFLLLLFYSRYRS